jgi:hypothetical protein
MIPACTGFNRLVALNLQHCISTLLPFCLCFAIQAEEAPSWRNGLPTVVEGIFVMDAILMMAYFSYAWYVYQPSLFQIRGSFFPSL